MQKGFITSLKLVFVGFCFALSQAQADESLLAQPEVKTFIQKMVQTHQFKEKDLNNWFKYASIQNKVLERIAKPSEALPWHRYLPIFLTPQRIDDGVDFWKKNQAALAKAQKEYGVSPEIIVAIIGVETFYGKKTGDFPVFDCLATLAFRYPPRSKFFLSELEQYLLLAREEGWPVRSIKGSYAGAMGMPQFISSSYRRFAIDFTGNQKRDLLNSTEDVIGSVANYFKASGWKPGEGVAYPAAISKNVDKMIAPKQNPIQKYSYAKMSSSGIQLHPDARITKTKLGDQPLALIALQEENGMKYWFGANNFYVITRYNHSDHYAMAVYTLSRKIKDGYLASA